MSETGPEPSGHPTVTWQAATIRRVIQETPRTKSFVFDLPNKLPHLAGQHCDLRLTAADGYQAARSYSIASPPTEPGLELTVQILPDGEVSGYLDQNATPGMQLEIKSPIGYHFVWTPDISDPVTLIGGGSGVVPLMCMMRYHRTAAVSTDMRLIYSARTWEDTIYREELSSDAMNTSGRSVIFTLTDDQPASWNGYRRRIDHQMLAAAAGLQDARRLFYICGPTPMVEAVANLLVKAGVSANKIKTERFGPTGKPND